MADVVYKRRFGDRKEGRQLVQGGGDFFEAAESLEFAAALQDGNQQGVRRDAEDFLKDEGADEAFEMVDALAPHTAIKFQMKAQRYEAFKVDMLFEQAYEFGLLLFHEF